MYLIGKHLLDKENALLLALSYGLGTALWPIASQSLWQHGPSVLWWTVCFYCLVRSERDRPQNSSNKFLFLAGVGAGCVVLCRTVNGVGMAVLCAAVLYRHRKQAVLFIAPAAVLSALLILYNITIFDSWKGGDVVLHSLHWELDRVSGGSWSTPLAVGLPGQLISPKPGDIYIQSVFYFFPCGE